MSKVIRGCQQVADLLPVWPPFRHCFGQGLGRIFQSQPFMGRPHPSTSISSLSGWNPERSRTVWSVDRCQPNKIRNHIKLRVWKVSPPPVFFIFRAPLVAQMEKHLPAMRETQVRSLCWEDPLKEMATHSSILAWRIIFIY